MELKDLTKDEIETQLRYIRAMEVADLLHDVTKEQLQNQLAIRQVEEKDKLKEDYINLLQLHIAAHQNGDNYVKDKVELIIKDISDSLKMEKQE